MSVEAPNSDADLLDLIRIAGPLSVSDLADAMEVTATAVRQRLTRLMAQAMIEREAIRAGRGRPKHRYSLTDKSSRQAGSNFTDLARSLWGEVTAKGDNSQSRDVLRRISRALAAGYAAQIEGTTPEERLQSLAGLLNQKRVPAGIGASASSVSDGHPARAANACSYPKLEEQDKNGCSRENTIFSESIGSEVELSNVD